ncbi:MAG: hypothetical protein SFW08_07245 [Gemmatimonadaceae bacterium]|nr:hypothetical protein [Gemmatimonadaceae bacterium]
MRRPLFLFGFAVAAVLGLVRCTELGSLTDATSVTVRMVAADSVQIADSVVVTLERTPAASVERTRWSISDTTRATLRLRADGSAVVRGRALGSVVLTATLEGTELPRGKVEATRSVAIIPGRPAALRIDGAPSGVALAPGRLPAFQVRFLDGVGNVSTRATRQVRLSLRAVGPAAVGQSPLREAEANGLALSGRTSVAAVAGVATFDSVVVAGTGTNVVLVAEADSVTATQSPSPVRVAAPARVVLLATPQSVTAGAAFSPVLRAAVQDSSGNTLVNSVGPITLAMADSGTASSSSLQGVLTASLVQGVGEFTGARLNVAATGVRLRVSAPGVPTAAISEPVTVTPASRSQLVVGAVPADIQAASAFPGDVQVRALDAFGNVVVSDTALITLSLQSPPTGVTLGGTLSRRPAQGVAVFPGLTVSASATGLRLAASSPGLTGSFLSSAFNVTPAAGPRSRVLFGTGPAASVIAGEPLATMTVRVTDASGILVRTATDTVSLTLVAPQGIVGAELRGVTRVAAVGGIATFSGLSVNRAAAGFNLVALATGLSNSVSSTFTVTPGAADRVQISTAPTTTTAGVAFAVSAAIADSLTNTQGSATGTLEIAVDSGPTGAVLEGTLARPVQAGTATFSGLVLRTVGRYRLRVCATSLRCGTSVLDVAIGAPERLRLVNAPAAAEAGVPFGAGFGVEILDAGGNRVTTSSATISLSLAAGPAGAVLSGMTSVNATAGVALFPTARLRATGAGYRVRATSGSLLADTGATFTVAPAPRAALRFVQQPTSSTVRTVLSPSITVEVVDSIGNRNGAGTPEIALVLNTSSQGITGTLGGTTTRQALGGLATFDDISVNRASVGWTLDARSASLASGTSQSFNVVAGAAAAIRFVADVPTARAGSPITPSVRVAVVDSSGELATSVAATPITIALGANPGNTTLVGTLTRSTVQGIATFDNLSLATLASGYTLVASSTAFGAATSNAFDVGPGNPAQLAFVVQPASRTAGTVIGPAVQVQIRDASGNPVVSSTDTVRLSLGANPGTDTLRGTLAVAAVGGIATFSDLRLRRAAAGITLRATGTGLTAATSSAFSITPAPAVSVRFSQQPSNVNVGVAFSPVVAAEVRDSLGNRVISDSATVVTIAPTDTSGGFGVSGTASREVVGGVATFTGLAVTAPAVARRLRVSAVGLGTDSSAAFNAVGPVVSFVIDQHPTPVVRGAAITPAIVVRGLDAVGQSGTGFTQAATLTVESGPTGQTISGTASVNPSSGTATFANAVLSAAGVTRLRVTSNIVGGGQVTAVTDTFRVAGFGVAASLTYQDQPTAAVIQSGNTTGSIPSFRVRVLDAQLNVVETAAIPITVALAPGSGCGPLGGTTTVTSAAGTAVFNALTVGSNGSGCQLVATTAGLPSVTSAAFSAINENDPASVVITTQPPTTATAGVGWNQIVAQVRNGVGAVASTYTGNVTLSVLSGPGTTTGQVIRTTAATAGAVSFTGVTLTVAGQYRFRVSAPGLRTDTTTVTLTVNPAPQSQLRVVREPTVPEVTAGLPYTGVWEVEITDQFGNRVPSFSTVTMTARTDACQPQFCFGGDYPTNDTTWFQGNRSVQAINGLARFAGMRFRVSANIQYVDFSTTGLSGARSELAGLPSSRISVLPAPAVRLAMAFGGARSAPYVSGSVANDPFGTPCGYTFAQAANDRPVATCWGDLGNNIGSVMPVDSIGNAAQSSGVVSATLLTDSTGMVLSGTTTVGIVATGRPDHGLVLGTGAYFGFFSLNRGGDNFRIRYSHPTLGSIDSPTFSVASFATVSRLVTTESPQGSVAAGATVTIRVAFQDNFGNIVTNLTRGIRLTPGTSTTPGSLPSGLTVTGPLEVNAVNGVATFTLTIGNTTGQPRELFFRVDDALTGTTLPPGGVPPFTVNP